MGLCVLGAVKTINACRCIGPSSPAEAYRPANAIVLAKVVQVEPRPELGGFSVSLFIERAWKSEVNQEFWITTGSGCLYVVEPERKYLLFLTRTPDKTFTTGQCMGNRPLAEGAKLIRWLDTTAKQASVIPPTCHSCHSGLP